MPKSRTDQLYTVTHSQLVFPVMAFLKMQMWYFQMKEQTVKTFLLYLTNSKNSF